MSNSHEISGIIIARNAYGESDLSIKLLSQQFGKITLIAKHAQKSTRRFQGRLELLDLINISAKPWKEDLWVLETSLLKNSHSCLRESLDRINVAIAACEISDLITQQNHPEDGASLFPLLSDFLSEVGNFNDKKNESRLLLKRFYDFLRSTLDYSGLLDSTELEVPASLNSLIHLISNLEQFCERPLSTKVEILQMAKRLKNQA